MHGVKASLTVLKGAFIVFTQTELQCTCSALECRTARALQSEQCLSSAALPEHCSDFVIWVGGTALPN